MDESEQGRRSQGTSRFAQAKVPELVFGHLLTSDNYNDSEKKAGAQCVCVAGVA